MIKALLYAELPKDDPNVALTVAVLSAAASAEAARLGREIDGQADLTTDEHGQQVALWRLKDRA